MFLLVSASSLRYRYLPWSIDRVIQSGCNAQPLGNKAAAWIVVNEALEEGPYVMYQGLL